MYHLQAAAVLRFTYSRTYSMGGQAGWAAAAGYGLYAAPGVARAQTPNYSTDMTCRAARDRLVPMVAFHTTSH